MTRWTAVTLSDEVGRDRVTVLGDDPVPGRQAQIDHGHLGSWIAPRSGKKRGVQALVLTPRQPRRIDPRPRPGRQGQPGLATNPKPRRTQDQQRLEKVTKAPNSTRRSSATGITWLRSPDSTTPYLPGQRTQPRRWHHQRHPHPGQPRLPHPAGRLSQGSSVEWTRCLRPR